MTIAKRSVLVTFAILLGVLCALAGNTGRIIGKVTDEKGEALPGAIVKVTGTNRGGVTDPDGKYVIIGVPAGEYTVEASLISYATTKAKNVKVGSDQTTEQDFKLTTSTVDLKEVVVTASGLVNKLTTSSETQVSSKSIENIPNVKDVSDVIKLQAGVVKQGNNLFLRGGRANEVQYLVDGIPSNSIMSNDGTTAGANADIAKFNAQSSGVIGGGGGLSISAGAIQSISVQSSGFDADFGNAQSGIISISTKSGQDKYTMSMQFRTDKLSSQNQNETYSQFSFGGPEPLTKYLLPVAGIHVPGLMTFFINADVNRADGSFNYVHNDFYNPLERKAELSGFLGGILNGVGFKFRDNQKNSFNLTSKLRYDASGSDQFFYRYTASLSSVHDFNNAWKYRADSSGLRASLSTQHALSWTHFFSTNTFVKINLGKNEDRTGNDVAGELPMDYSNTFTSLDPFGTGFNMLGSEQNWSSGTNRIWSARVDFNSQVHQYHLLKTGFEFTYEEIASTQILYPTASINDTAGNPIYPPFPDSYGLNRGLYPGYGNYRWNLSNYPNHGAAFVQDNIEFSGLNFHVGLRYDYFDIGHQVYYQDYVDAWERASLMKAEWVENAPEGKSFKYYLTHGYVSPRLSIGYPVTDRIVFYFNYGHFYQFPDRGQYFRDPFVERSQNLIGNPDLKPQRTVNYEAGFEDQFSDDMAFSVHAFYKDIFDYATTVPVRAQFIYKNLDYASTRGFEFTFRQALSGSLSINASYTYQIAKGRSSNPLTSIYNPQFQLPRETRLDWDQNHTINVFANYRIGADQPGEFFGLPFFNNYGMSLTYNFGSGFPYTPDYGQRTSARTVYLVNNETRPFTSTVDFSFWKGFMLMNHLNVRASLDITNLFNRKNIATGSNSAGFNQNTGAPFAFGDADPSSSVIYSYRSIDSRTPPYIFDAPRQILLGVSLGWE